MTIAKDTYRHKHTGKLVDVVDSTSREVVYVWKTTKNYGVCSIACFPDEFEPATKVRSIEQMCRDLLDVAGKSGIIERPCYQYLTASDLVAMANLLSEYLRGAKNG